MATPSTLLKEQGMSGIFWATNYKTDIEMMMGCPVKANKCGKGSGAQVL